MIANAAVMVNFGIRGECGSQAAIGHSASILQDVELRARTSFIPFRNNLKTGRI